MTRQDLISKFYPILEVIHNHINRSVMMEDVSFYHDIFRIDIATVLYSLGEQGFTSGITLNVSAHNCKCIEFMLNDTSLHNDSVLSSDFFCNIGGSTSVVCLSNRGATAKVNKATYQEEFFMKSTEYDLSMIDCDLLGYLCSLPEFYYPKRASWVINFYDLSPLHNLVQDVPDEVSEYFLQEVSRYDWKKHYSPLPAYSNYNKGV